MFDKIIAHTSFIGETGYANHSRNFFTALNKIIPVKVRNFTVGKTWNGLKDGEPHNDEWYLTDEHKEMLYKQTCMDNGQRTDHYIYGGSEDDEKGNNLHIILNEVNHYYFYDEYDGPKIAYNVWESTLYPDEFFNRLIGFDQLWVPTEWQKDCSISQGYSESRVKVVPEAVDGNIFFPEKIEKDDGRFKFLLFGRWEYRKSTKEIIDAFLKTFNKKEPVDLIVSIDNNFAEDGLRTTEDRLKHYGFDDDRIKVKHFPTREDYLNYLKAGHVFLSCARSEGWNLPLIESMACGTPSIYSDWGAQLEFAESKGFPVKITRELPSGKNNITGNYCEPDFDDLINVMRNTYKNYHNCKIRAMKESGMIREEYSWENAAKKAIDSINELENISVRFDDYSPNQPSKVYYSTNSDRYIEDNYSVKLREYSTGLLLYSVLQSISKGVEYWMSGGGIGRDLGGLIFEIYSPNGDLIIRKEEKYDNPANDIIIDGKKVQVSSTYNDGWFTFYEIFLDKTYEYKDCFVEDGDICLDIGANIGLFGLYALSHKAKEVHCVEPVSSTYSMLNNNVCSFKNIHTYPVGLGKDNKDMEVAVSRTQSAISSAFPDKFSEHLYDSENEIIKIVNINDFIKQNDIKNIDFLKIDCEGGEYDIFESINEDYLKNHVKKIIGEYHFSYSGELDKIISKLERCGFNCTIKETHSEFKVGMFYAKKNEAFIDDSEIAFIMSGDAGYMPLVEVAVKSLLEFTNNKIIVYSYNCDVPFEYENVINKRLDFNVEEIGYGKVSYDLYFAKIKCCLDALNDNDFKNFIWIDSDIVATENMPKIKKYLYQLENYPMVCSHLFDYIIFDNKEVIGEDFMAKMGVDISNRPCYPWVQTCLMVFNHQSEWFFKEIDDLVTNITDGDKDKYFKYLCDEVAINAVLNKYGFNKKLKVHTYHSETDDDVSLYYSPDWRKKYNYMSGSISNHSVLPITRDDVYLIHGIKDSTLAQKTLTQYKNYVQKSDECDIIIVNAFIDNVQKEKILKECICSLKKSGKEILLTSHSIISSDIQEMVDYYVYDSYNPLFSFKDSDYYWYTNNNIEFQTRNFGIGAHSLAALLSLQNGVKFAKAIGKKFFYHLEYDNIISPLDIPTFDNIKNRIKLENRKGYVELYAQGMDQKDFNSMSMIFFACDVDFFLDKINIPRDESVYRKGTNDVMSERYLFSKLRGYINLFIVERRKDGIAAFSNSRKSLCDSSTNISHHIDIVPLKEEKNRMYLFISNEYKDEVEYEIICDGEKEKSCLPTKGCFYKEVTNNKNIKVLCNKELAFKGCVEDFLKNRTTIEYLEFKNNKENNDKKYFITFDSKSLGDNLAWMPYAEEFRKKHDCKVVLSTFWNDLFKKEYPEIEFIGRGEVVRNIHGQHNIGWYFPWDSNKNPNDFRTIPLQQTASDILGLDYKEIKPKITILDKPRAIEEKYVCIGMHSTCQSKYWNYPDGWQKITDYLNEKGYKVVHISKEQGEYMGNSPPKNIIDKTGNFSIEDRLVDLKHADMFIGIGSGLSWLSWAIGTPTILISGFSAPFCEPTEGIERIHNSNVCNSCFNDPNIQFDPGDWNWCPRNKDFECSKAITPDVVIQSINKILSQK